MKREVCLRPDRTCTRPTLCEANRRCGSTHPDIQRKAVAPWLVGVDLVTPAERLANHPQKVTKR